MKCSLHNGTKSSVKSRLLNSVGHVLNHSLKNYKTPETPWLTTGPGCMRDGEANALKGVEGDAEYGSTSARVNKLRCPFPG